MARHLFRGYTSFLPTVGNLSRVTRFTDDLRKVRFAQTHRTIRAGMICATGDDSRNAMDVSPSKLLCCVSFKLRFNYFIYLIYQLFMWALLVADVNLGYMHLSTEYYTL